MTRPGTLRRFLGVVRIDDVVDFHDIYVVESHIYVVESHNILLLI
jgi:hypothetical protein